jgi:F-type H+-transporting ATPase subunit a
VAAAGKIDPMHQFTIAPLGSDQLAASPFQFTNSALWMLVVLVVIVAFMWGGLKRELVPGRWQAAVEYLTGFLDNVTTQSIGPQGRKYLPWIFTAFTFILAANWVGAMPFGIVPAAHPFTVTSQFTVTGTMSIISFLVRPFSLGLRPFIAMFAGHILLEVFGSFVVQGLNTGTALGYGVTALAFLFVVFVNALELLVGAIQAFVFALLTALYINDAVNLH